MPIRIFFRCFTAILVALCLTESGRADVSSVNWRTDLDAAMIEAARTNRLLLLHFWTAKCGPCVVLEQNVFSQPHVGAAIEQEYVPVKIDADDKPALASQFRIDRVPTEIVMTSQGNVVATLSSPNQPDAYISQLQNLARHFRQTTASAPGGAQQAAINPAYSNLPVTPAAPRPQYNQYVHSPAVSGAGAAVPASPTSAAPGTPVNQHGQAESVYATQPAAPPQKQPAATVQSSPATNASLVASTTTMPANAMPRSYRNPNATEGAAAAAAVTNSTPSTVGGTSAVVPTVPAASPHTAVAAAPAAAATGAVAPSAPTSFTGLPADAPPVAFDGCCPVTLKTLKKWTAGNPALGIVHRGRTYLFAGEAERNQFWADPDGYSPVFAGLDPVLLLESRQSVPGTRQYGYEYGGLFYLFSSKETMDRFAASPSTYAAGVRQAMNRIDASSADVLRR